MTRTGRTLQASPPQPGALKRASGFFLPDFQLVCGHESKPFRRFGHRTVRHKLQHAPKTDLPSAAACMDGLEISATFSGMTMTGNYGNGVKFTESYLPDGSLSYQDDEGSDHGRWFVRGSLFCTFYEASEGACYSVRKSAENCFEYFTQEKEDGSTHENAGAWNSVGWDQFKPTSCDLADKVS